MTIEKHHGGYRISKMVNGKRYRVYVDHQPTESEAFMLIAKKANEVKPTSDITFENACNLYCESKTNVLSVTTISGYKALMRSMDKAFLNTNLSKMTLPIVQAEISRYSIGHKPKTVKNMSGFIMGVLKYYGLDFQSPKRPQEEKKDIIVPTYEEVKLLAKELEGSDIEIPFLLACRGMRRSEICALTPEDINGLTVSINKALVLDTNRKWVVKPTKTTESTREIVISKKLAKLIKKQGYIYNEYPGKITDKLRQTQKKLGVREFRLHDLRHFSCSFLHDLGYSDKAIMAWHGWKSTYVLNSVYKHAMNMEKVKLKMAADFDKLLEKDI